MDTADADRPFDQIREVVEQEFRQLGEEMRDDIRTIVGVPVQYQRSPKSNVRVYVVRSRPFEPPRKEYGNLWTSMAWQVARVAAEIVLRVYSDSPISAYLEGGTPRIEPRPHWKRLLERWEDRIIERVAARIGQATAGGASSGAASSEPALQGAF